MTATKQREQDDELDQGKRDALSALIREQVIHDLGEPKDLHLVQVRRLWHFYYRVNVLVGQNAACARIANSFFVTANRDGNIIASNPKITKHYGA